MSKFMKLLISFFLVLMFPSSFFAQVIRPDSSFNGLGFDSIHIDAFVTTANEILKNPTDNNYFIRCSDNLAVLKYKRKGTLDSGFNNIGYLKSINALQYTPQMELILDDQNRFVFSALSPNTGDDMAFQLVKQNGKTDSSFGTNGILTVPNSSDKKGGLFQLPDKSFLAITGLMVNSGSGAFYNLKLSKYKKNYSIDSSFGLNGSKLIPTNLLTFYLNRKGVFFYNNGNILICATTRSEPYSSTQGYDYNIQLFRFKPNGEFDSTFGVNGIASPKYGEYLEEGVYSVKLFPDGKIVTFGFGSRQNNSSRIASVNRFLPNGSIDTTFAFFGRFLSNNFIEFFDGVIQKDNKLICSGGYDGFNLERIREDGFPDLQFGATNSYYRSPFTYINNQFTGGFPLACLLESDTSLIVTGNAFNQSNNITTASYKINFQPLVTGVKTNYCIGTPGNGIIINMPLTGSDTIVKVYYDNVILPISPAGLFSFTNSVTGQHIILVQFIKGTVIWQETIKLNVRNLPIANAGPDAGICNGSVTLGGNALANTYYLWTSPTQGIISTFANPVVSPAVSTTYILTASNGGCSSKDTVIVNVGSLIINAGQDKTICTGSSTTIGPAASPGLSYNWTSIPAGFTSTIVNPVVAPTANTVYILSVTNGNCTGKDTVLISVASSPVANAGPDKNICSGFNSTTIGTPAITGYTYSWLPATGLNNATIAEPVAAPNTNTTYMVTVTNTEGCKSSDNVNITLIPRFVINLPDTLINLCLGKSVTIGAIPQAGFNYNWSSVPSGFSSNLANPSVSPTVNTRYILTQTNTNTLCSDTASVNVIIDANCFTGNTIFPNPSNGKIVIQLHPTNGETLVFELIDGSGKNVYLKESNASISLTVNNIQSGIYYYTIRRKLNGEILNSGKLLIQK